MGENTTFEQLKRNIQAVIDLLAIRKLKEANNRLQSIQEHIEAILDTTSDDLLLVEVSKYQILVQHLQQKIFQSE
ncbi:hypothetical protein [Flavobacterium tibetense]|jgi:hypothetical protein|uniref:Uncharacterized protein n=1 Tax=Flavobacterium tibetense TaxID=2233533 RepID=A0A365NZG1_9FLAO|nr:hypothetical protein [Flavobacterium tibetense]RBA27627.1 hypothetical protein DPN68_11185 [Flavobacterium tibetense]